MKKILGLFFIALFISCSSTNFVKVKNAYKEYKQTQIEFIVLKAKHKWLNYEIFSIIKDECSKYYTLTPSFVCAVIQNESADACNNDLNKMLNVMSYAGAVGIMQIMPKYHLQTHESWLVLFNAKTNIKKGCAFLNWCMSYSRNNLVETLRCYNSGPYSHYYNVPYINRIIKAHLETTEMLKNVELS
jgi:soluble lytic murein transglycosylase-like protein